MTTLRVKTIERTSIRNTLQHLRWNYVLLSNLFFYSFINYKYFTDKSGLSMTASAVQPKSTVSTGLDTKTASANWKGNVYSNVSTATY